MMSERRMLVATCFALSLLLPAAVRGQATSASPDERSAWNETFRRFQELAPRVVKSARIQRGDIVTISGGTKLVPAMETPAIEVMKAGGLPVMTVNSPRAARAYYTEVPDEYLGQSSAAWDDFYAQHVDVDISLPFGEDPQTVFRDVPPERQAQVDMAGAEGEAASAKKQNTGKTRYLFIGIPTPADRVSVQMDYAQWEAMTWDAIGANYDQIVAQGNAIKRVLEQARKLRIRSPEGTDFTVPLGDRPVVVEAGIVPPGTPGAVAARSASLPGGLVRFAPIETSANGKIRVAEDQCEQLVKNEAMEVRSGMAEKVRADSDEACLQRSLKDAGRFGFIEIGLNPTLKFSRVPRYGGQLDEGAGIVTIAFGSNQDLGGENGPVAGGWFVPLLRATVEADGKVIVKEGKLVPLGT